MTAMLFSKVKYNSAPIRWEDGALHTLSALMPIWRLSGMLPSKAEIGLGNLHMRLT